MYAPCKHTGESEKKFQLCPLLVLKAAAGKSACWQLLRTHEWQISWQPCSPEEICKTLTVSSILDTNQKPSSITGRETLKCTSVWSNLPIIYLILFLRKNCALNSVPLPDFFNWQHCTLSRQSAGKSSLVFMACYLSTGGNNTKLLTMKPDIVWSWMQVWDLKSFEKIFQKWLVFKHPSAFVMLTDCIKNH